MLVANVDGKWGRLIKRPRNIGICGIKRDIHSLARTCHGWLRGVFDVFMDLNNIRWPPLPHLMWEVFRLRRGYWQWALLYMFPCGIPVWLSALVGCLGELSICLFFFYEWVEELAENGDIYVLFLVPWCEWSPLWPSMSFFFMFRQYFCFRYLLLFQKLPTYCFVCKYYLFFLPTASSHCNAIDFACMIRPTLGIACHFYSFPLTAREPTWFATCCTCLYNWISPS